MRGLLEREGRGEKKLAEFIFLRFLLSNFPPHHQNTERMTVRRFFFFLFGLTPTIWFHKNCNTIQFALTEQIRLQKRGEGFSTLFYVFPSDHLFILRSANVKKKKKKKRNER